jgi:5-methyltetrahydrofolate--homocysteine methyltransferase
MNIQLRNPSLDDFQGKEGYNDILVPSRPDLIREIHAATF